jgi:hypothetical protein
VRSGRRIISICRDYQERLEIDLGLLLKIITGAETWVYECDPETKEV